jgi:excisionase family DNA binding protein
MSSRHHHDHHLDDDRLLTPREVAEVFGVRTTTIARWSREGRLASFLTPGGHRRYRLPDVQALLEDAEPAETELDRQTAEDAVRLYNEGWSIRQVAEKFDLDYTTMRRLLKRNGVTFRPQRRTGP